MGKQLHTRLSTEAVTDVLGRYVRREVDLTSALMQLKVKRSRFFGLLKKYNADASTFSVTYERSTPKRITDAAETLIAKELEKEKELITNPAIPIREYNYSAIRDALRDKHQTTVSVPTIIARAKAQGCYLEKKVRRIHDREVLTNYVGELIQHDSSHHQWSPFVETKWYCITSLDDYSRLMVFGDLFEVENRWNHIMAAESVVLSYGAPRAYYADQHSIFRFVKKRDTLLQKNVLETDEVDPQWKQVLKDCDTEVIYALSPQAKGKIERPYRWMQGRVVRRCAQDHVVKFTEVRQIFREEIERYNTRTIHSTTKAVPIIRYEQAVKDGKTMFRRFQVPKPYQSSKDIFCLRATRVVDAYRKISICNLKITVPKVPPRYPVELRIVLDSQKHTVEVRLWFSGQLVSIQIFKEQDLPIVQF